MRRFSVWTLSNEFTIRSEDRPGTLGKLCQSLAEQDINILAYEQYPHEEGQGSDRLVMDNPDKTRATLGSPAQRL